MNRVSSFMILLSSMAVFLVNAQENWPQFRGPQGNGISHARHLPLSWSETNHVTWKVPIQGKAWSSPVIWSNQVWLTTASTDGRALGVLCLDRASGKILLDKKLYDVDRPPSADAFTSDAAPTPCIESGRVCVSFGSSGTACLDTSTGAVLWERHDLICNLSPGAISSPVLFLDRLIMNFDGSDHQFVVALDKKTGKTVWQTPRSVDLKDLTPVGKGSQEGDGRKAFSTPLVVLNGSQFTVVSLGSKALYAYDFTTGHELWRVEEPSSHNGGVRPIYGLGMIYYCTGLPKGQLWAVRPGGSNVVTDTHVAWKSARNIPARPSPLLIGDLLYTVDDAGVVICLEAKTGTDVWRERVPGNYSSSPVAGDNRIYLFNQEGKATILEPGRKFKVLAQNQLEDGLIASPAVYGRALYLRTKKALYRIEEPLTRP